VPRRIPRGFAARFRQLSAALFPRAEPADARFAVAGASRSSPRNSRRCARATRAPGHRSCASTMRRISRTNYRAFGGTLSPAAGTCRSSRRGCRGDAGARHDRAALAAPHFGRRCADRPQRGIAGGPTGRPVLRLRAKLQAGRSRKGSEGRYGGTVWRRLLEALFCSIEAFFCSISEGPQPYPLQRRAPAGLGQS